MDDVRVTNGRLKRSLVLVMAMATGLAVANNYYAQPLLPLIARNLRLTSGVAALIVTVAQFGYALGLLFLLPLGDLVERRRLIVLLSLGTGVALLCLGAAPNEGVLFPAALVVGSLSVLAQVLVPFSASLASPQERGRVVGMVMSGLLIGILLARTVSGLLAQTGSWRIVYFAAGAVMFGQAGLLHRVLPTWKEENDLSYRRLLRSVGTLLKEEPMLRRRSLFGFFSFGTFSVLWTSMAFVLSRHYHDGPGIIGLFGLAGAAGALTASVAGRLSDSGRSRATTGVATALLVMSWAALWAGGRSVALLVIGIVVLDIGAQGLHITNQGEIYRLRPEARSRLTAAYMVIYFIGGGVGSAVSGIVYAHLGWGGVCVVGEVFAAMSFSLWLVTLAHPPATHMSGSGRTTEVGTLGAAPLDGGRSPDADTDPTKRDRRS
jgi:predicted MFS family arabinose efflux permease